MGDRESAGNNRAEAVAYGKKESISTWGWADVVESYSWPGYEGKEIRLDIYSDAEEVEIAVNGKVLNKLAVPESGIVQTNITYEPGTIAVTNYRNGIESESSILRTTGDAVALKLTAEQTDADDVRIVVVEAVDAEGNRVPYDCSKVTAETSEGLLLVGFGTGDPVTEENFTTDTCTLYEGRALMVLKKTAEDGVKVTVSDGKITTELQL